MVDSLNIKPGRELDALIGSKVLGRRIEDYGGHLVFHCDGPSNKVYPFDYLVPRYSTDIAAAWKVAEKMHMTVCNPDAPFADGEYANQGNYNNPEEKYQAECTRLNAKDWSDTVCAYGLTAPHAICLCALKAVGAL